MTKPDTENTDKETSRRPKGRQATDDLDPATAIVEDDEDERLPEPAETMGEDVPPSSPGTGREAILRAARLAPAGAGVYRMLNADHEVLYVGKAKSLRKRLISYTRPTGHDTRIARMIAATVTLEIVSTRTETEA